MTHPRVLVLSATPVQGSWATSRLMVDLFADWPTESLAQITVSRPGSDPAAQTIESLYLDLSGSPNPFRIADQFRRAWMFVRDTQPDVIYFRTAGWPIALELFALLLTRCPMVTHVMDDWPESRRAGGLRLAETFDGVLRRVLVRSKARLAISQSMAAAFTERYGVPFDVVHAGSAVEPGPSPRPSRSEEEQLIFYSGSIAQDQTATSLVVLANAVALLRGRGTPVQLRVAPSSEMPTELAVQLESAGAVIDEQGSQVEYHERLASADVVVATANFDEQSIAFLRYSMPNKIPDLLSSGTPILVFAPAELAYVQLADEAGWARVVDIDDVEVLASAIDDLLRNEAMGSQLLVAASEARATTFAWPELRKRFERVLRDAI